MNANEVSMSNPERKHTPVPVAEIVWAIVSLICLATLLRTLSC